MGLVRDGLVAGERIAVYLQNNSVQKVTMGEIRVAGTVYTYISATTTGLSDPWNVLGGDLWDARLVGPSYMVATSSNGLLGAETPATMLATTSAEIQPGQQATIIIQLDDNVKVGRDTQFKLTTANGAVFVGTIIAGQQSG